MSAPKRALVTGAGGFVGANLVRRLLSEGHDVSAAIRPGSVPWRLDGVAGDVRLLEIDLLDDERLARSVETLRPEWAFHLAAHGAYSWQDDSGLIMRTNALTTVSLVQACASAGCEAFVHAGSSSEYGFKDRPPSEDESADPNSAYAVAKLAATNFCRHAARSGALNAVTLRLYSVYGPFEDPRRLIPTLLVHALRGELPPLVAPATARDFVTVADAVEAFVAAAAHTAHEPGAIYNIGSGRQTSVGELVGFVCDLLPVEAEPAWGSAAARGWDTPSWQADPARAVGELGWSPSLDVRAGLEQTISWLRSTPQIREAYGVDI